MRWMAAKVKEDYYKKVREFIDNYNENAIMKMSMSDLIQLSVSEYIEKHKGENDGRSDNIGQP